MKKFISFALALILTCSLSTTAFAANNASEKATLQETPTLSNAQIDRLNDWVSYDEKEKQYTINTAAKEKLSNEDYSLLNTCITITNSNLSNIDLSSDEVSVVSPENESNSIAIGARAKHSEGVTKMKLHWWGATIYLSKTTINRVGAGVAIGGIWIPEPVLSKVLSTLGVVASLVPGGIVFDYNYIAAGINQFVPGSSLVFSAVSNIRWQ